MSNVRVLMALLCALVLSVPAFAEGKIAVLSRQKAILNTDLAQKQFKQLEADADYKEARDQLAALQKQGEEMVAKLKKDSAIMSDDQKQEMSKKLHDLEADAQHYGKKLQEAQQAKFQDVVREIGPRFQKVVMDLIQSEGIGLLLDADSGSVLQADSSYDITAKVTDNLNRSQ